MKIRKLLFVLPNLFTVTSIFCGFYSVVLSAENTNPKLLTRSAIAVLFALFFDAFDGRVARLTKTQSQFGVELDSLADVISFGVAPALLVYQWALAPLGFLGFFLSFLFAACGALRLARFNVLAQRSSKETSRFFVGLPIPLAAGMLASWMLAHSTSGVGEMEPGFRGFLAGFVLVISLLMVSTVRYRAFKQIKWSRAALPSIALIVLGAVFLAVGVHPAYLLIALFSAYLILGLLESSLRFIRRRSMSSGS